MKFMRLGSMIGGKAGVVATVLLGLGGGAPAGGQTVSVVSANYTASASAGGDSGAPVVSADGRYVLFASTANNLARAGGNPMTGRFPPLVNVYWRDRLTGTTKLVSINAAGTGGGNGDSAPVGISTNGQFALFESGASDLVGGDTNQARDVFVRDMVNGTTLLVSVSVNGGTANAGSGHSVMTPDGRYVAFASAASDLAPGDTNLIADVFLRDVAGGTTTWVSAGAVAGPAVPPAGTALPVGSGSPAVTPDGRYVAFFSTASNLVSGAAVLGEVYVRDVQAGATAWASSNAPAILNSLGGAPPAVAYDPRISDDGAYVAFEASPLGTNATATGIVLRHNRQTGVDDIVNTNVVISRSPGEEAGNLSLTPDGRYVAFVGVVQGSGFVGTNSAVYLWDGQGGTTSPVSVDLGSAVPTNGVSVAPVVDASGRYVAFLSTATNLTVNAYAGDMHLYRRDVLAGVTQMVDTDTNGVGTGVSAASAPAMSADGQWAAFESASPSLVASDRNRCFDVFMRNLGTGAIEMVSARDSNQPGATPNGLISSIYSASTNGNFVAYASDADDIVPGDTNGVTDVFVRDMANHTNILVSAGLGGEVGNGASSQPSISGDGRYVAFVSLATNLVAGYAGKAQQIYVRDLVNGSTVLASLRYDGTAAGSGNSASPTLSWDGRYLLFSSLAVDLTSAGSGTGQGNLYLRDLVANTNLALTGPATAGGAIAAVMTPDGKRVAFAGRIPGSSTLTMYVWDRPSATLIFSTNAPGGTVNRVAISANGGIVAYRSLLWYVHDLTANTTRFVSSMQNYPPRFSGDGRYFAFLATTAKLDQSDSNNLADIYVQDVQSTSNTLVSRRYTYPGSANAAPDSPEISLDGRFVAYRSTATDVEPGVTDGGSNLYLYDRIGGGTTLVSADWTGRSGATGLPLAERFSGDGRTLLVRSLAPNLTGGDFNGLPDLVSYSVPAPAVANPGDPGANFPLSVGPAVLPGQPFVPGGALMLSWPAVAGWTYHIQYKDDLNAAVWQTLAGNVVFEGGYAYIDDPQPSQGQRYYRVTVN